jgi:hypothetical protein
VDRRRYTIFIQLFSFLGRRHRDASAQARAFLDVFFTTDPIGNAWLRRVRCCRIVSAHPRQDRETTPMKGAEFAAVPFVFS